MIKAVAQIAHDKAPEKDVGKRKEGRLTNMWAKAFGLAQASFEDLCRAVSAKNNNAADLKRKQRPRLSSRAATTAI